MRVGRACPGALLRGMGDLGVPAVMFVALGTVSSLAGQGCELGQSRIQAFEVL